MESEYLKQALEQAKLSVEQGGFPAGAVIVKDGEVIAEGISIGFKLHDPTSHAETVAIRNACKVLQTTNLEGCTLYASLQPCIMCFSGANWAGITKIVYGTHKTREMADKQYYEGHNNIEDINKNNTREIELTFMPGIEEESLALVEKWETRTQ